MFDLANARLSEISQGNPARGTAHRAAGDSRALPQWKPLLPLLRPFQVHLDRRAAFRALAGLVSLHRLRLGERKIKFLDLVLGMSAPGALDAHSHDHRDAVIHGGSSAAAYRHSSRGGHRPRTPAIVG